MAPYATFGTPELAELTLDALEGRAAALMANHGTIALGPDPDGAADNAAAARMGVHDLTGAPPPSAPRGCSMPTRQQDFIDAVTARGYGSVQERTERR